MQRRAFFKAGGAVAAGGLIDSRLALAQASPYTLS